MNSIPTADQIKQELARRIFLRFVTLMMFDYIVNWHHALIAAKLQLFVEGKIKYLMILMPSQHGKSELASIQFPAYMLGRNPDTRIAGISYSREKAQEFNVHTRRVMESPQYIETFPETRLKGPGAIKKESDKAHSKSMSLIEVVGKRGFYYSVGITGPLTGKRVDVLILDDTVKDRAQALSPAIRKRNNLWWDAVARKRLHAKSQVLVVNTRWAHSDLCEYILTQMREGTGFEFEIILLPRIKENNDNPDDPREIGETLWPEMHTLEEALKSKKSNPAVFQALDQQDPSTPKEIRVFSNWNKIDKLPEDLPRFYGEDFGFSADPDTLIECCYHKGKGYVRERMYKNQQGTKALAKKVKTLDAKNGPIYADGSEPRLISDLRDEGINVKAAIKGPGSILAGIEFLHGIEMHYTADSYNLETEYKNYQWPVGPDGKPIADNPVDEFNHCMDAIRYAFYSHVKRPVSYGGWV